MRGILSPDALPLFRELNDLKRIRSSGRAGSIATRLFRAAWRGVVEGDDALAMVISARALAAARLGDLDAQVLGAAGLAADEIRTIEAEAIRGVGDGLPTDLLSSLVAALGAPSRDVGPTPPFVTTLEEQPRAGVTCPGKPRILLEPPENHAEHCLLVAVYGVLLAPAYGAAADIVFLAGLSHHFHNAGMPDAGFTGEMLLGAHLDRVIAHHTEACYAELDSATAQRVREARKILADADTPEGRAFHAADVIDRVLQIEQHLRAATLTMDVVLGEMSLVHEGPVKGFHDRVLRDVGLL